MKKHSWYALCFLLLNIIFSSFSPREKKIISSGNSVAGMEPFDEEMNRFMSKWKVPGGSLALVKDGKVVYSRAFGYAEEGIPLQESNRFRIASLSKPITSVAIFRLIETGKLSLRDKVFGKNGILNEERYLHFTDPRIEKITIRHLLEHTAGWDREYSACGDPMFDAVRIARCMKASAPASAETVLQYMLGKNLDFQPGSHYAYSNFGYSVLGRVIEKISGMSYETFVRQQILAPMGISGMKLGRNLYCDKETDEVRYYDSGQRKIPSVCEPGQKVPFPYGGFNLEAMDAHGGWIASAGDLAKFITGVAACEERKGILKKENYLEMFEPCAVNLGYAKGWFINRSGNFWHTGCLNGSSSMMAHTGDNLSWVLLFNSSHLTEEYFSDMDQLIWRALRKAQLKASAATTTNIIG